MKNTLALQIKANGDREIVMTRGLRCPAQAGLRRFHQAGTPQAVVARSVRLEHAGLRNRPLRIGGRYRYVWRRDTDGTEMGCGGDYREIVPPERLVHTEQFDNPWYSGESLITTVLDEQRGKTTLTATMLYESRDARDGILKSGMESGVAASYDRLA